MVMWMRQTGDVVEMNLLADAGSVFARMVALYWLFFRVAYLRMNLSLAVVFQPNREIVEATIQFFHSNQCFEMDVVRQLGVQIYYYYCNWVWPRVHDVVSPGPFSTDFCVLLHPLGNS